MTIIPLSEGSDDFRTFLFLQGPPSRFWTELSDSLTQGGHRVLKVHFCLSDLVFWGLRRGRAYLRPFSDWGSWLEELLRRENVTDIIYYADRLPYHVEALRRGRSLRVRVWAIEFGYLRPDWITLEPEAMGAFSRFPGSREAISALARHGKDPDMTVRYAHGFANEAFHEVSYNLLQSLGRPIFPFYRSDKVYWPLLEYLSWIPELLRTGRYERDASLILRRIGSGELSYNLVAMQLEADYQIRASSKYGGNEEFLEEVMASFSAHAPADRHLLIKIHPLDSGIVNWFRRIGRLADSFGIDGRTHVVKAGALREYLGHSSGVVLVNSTVGLHALHLGVPVCALGTAVFDRDGLTHRSGLDAFWTAPEQVDREYFSTFARALSTIQVKGSFYEPNGRRAAINEIRKRICRDGDAGSEELFAGVGE